jgi:uncharacterized membrane protein YciS (DUF1049 family)
MIPQGIIHIGDYLMKSFFAVLFTFSIMINGLFFIFFFDKEQHSNSPYNSMIKSIEQSNEYIVRSHILCR